MDEWAKQHPWMTFVLVLAAIFALAWIVSSPKVDFTWGQTATGDQHG